jgi:hypothetical protein
LFLLLLVVVVAAAAAAAAAIVVVVVAFSKYFVHLYTFVLFLFTLRWSLCNSSLTPSFDAARHTFRPPWYHRNVATEFNFIIELPQSYSGFEKGSYWYDIDGWSI